MKKDPRKSEKRARKMSVSIMTHASLGITILRSAQSRRLTVAEKSTTRETARKSPRRAIETIDCCYCRTDAGGFLMGRWE